MNKYDVIIIGSGVCGAAMSRELSRYQLKIAVLEKGDDVCVGASKANSATVHSGHDATYGTKKAHYNILGNAMYDKLCSELSVPFTRNGTIIFALSESEMQEIIRLKENAEMNNVPGVQTLSRSELITYEGYFGTRVIGGLIAPTGGVVCPYGLTIAMCENSCRNGVEFFLNTEVSAIQKNGTHFTVHTNNQDFQARYIFNCAGVHADEINNMLSSHKIRIIPRKGAHLILDKKLAGIITATLSQTPSPLPGGGHTKGLGIVPSVDGTLILGCDAYTVTDKDDTTTDAASIEYILDYFTRNWQHFPLSIFYPELPREMIIGAFAGTRPHLETDDYIIGEAEDVPGFFNLAGIESPGLTAAPAIARDVATEAARKYNFDVNPYFSPLRKHRKPFREMSYSEKEDAITENPDYSEIICRCEQITLAEVLQAIHAPLGARSVDAVKMRTRAGMGRCQGGFCSSRIIKILASELNIPVTEVNKCGAGSNIVPYEI